MQTWTQKQIASFQLYLAWSSTCVNVVNPSKDYMYLGMDSLFKKTSNTEICASIYMSSPGNLHTWWIVSTWAYVLRDLGTY